MRSRQLCGPQRAEADVSPRTILNCDSEIPLLGGQAVPVFLPPVTGEDFRWR